MSQGFFDVYPVWAEDYNAADMDSVCILYYVR